MLPLLVPSIWCSRLRFLVVQQSFRDHFHHRNHSRPSQSCCCSHHHHHHWERQWHYQTAINSLLGRQTSLGCVSSFSCFCLGQELHQNLSHPQRVGQFVCCRPAAEVEIADNQTGGMSEFAQSAHDAATDPDEEGKELDLVEHCLIPPQEKSGNQPRKLNIAANLSGHVEISPQ